MVIVKPFYTRSSLHRLAKPYRFFIFYDGQVTIAFIEDTRYSEL